MITLIAAALLTPTTASMPRKINLDGVRATYTRSVDANGTVHLRGRYHGEGSSFHYRVRGGRVEGQVGKTSVTFPAPRG